MKRMVQCFGCPVEVAREAAKVMKGYPYCRRCAKRRRDREVPDR